MELDDVEKKIVFQALEDYEDRVKRDLRTKYQGDPRWSDKEDGDFLRELLRKIAILKGKVS